MNKISTLIYFVNNYQTDFEEINEKESLILNFEEMEKKEEGPSELSIQNILNFARSYEVCKTKETGYIEMNLN